MKVEDELVGVKFYKVMVDAAGVPPYYEYHMQKHFQMKGDAEPKSSGETFSGADMNTLMFRLVCYVRGLNLRGIEKSVLNKRY